MNKYINVTLEVLLNALILSFLGAMIRILFTKIEQYLDTVRLFVGSILFGSVAGYTLNDFIVLKPYLKVIIVLFSIFGKEMYIWLENIFSNPAKWITFFLKSFKGIKVNITNNKDNDIT